MNKLLIVLLAVCLVSVHAFVKRETAAPAGNDLESIKKQLTDIGASVKDELEKLLNPEEMKKKFDEAMDTISKTFNDIKEHSAAPPKQ